jgi:hypothetical protein
VAETVGARAGIGHRVRSQRLNMEGAMMVRDTFVGWALLAAWALALPAEARVAYHSYQYGAHDGSMSWSR